MSSLDHENLCKFLGICVERNRAQVLSELMDCSLFELIHIPGTLSWRGKLNRATTLSISRGICSGISYLHTRQLVHADLKSSNILIDYSTLKIPIAKICDFGHVAVRTHPAPHDRCGTPHWAAPEALRNEAVSKAADVFSFGVMLWEMLTKNLPHQALTFAQVVGAVGWSGWTPDLDSLPHSLPPELLKLLTDCLSFFASGRPDISQTLQVINNVAEFENTPRGFPALGQVCACICQPQFR